MFQFDILRNILSNNSDVKKLTRKTFRITVRKNLFFDSFGDDTLEKITKKADRSYTILRKREIYHVYIRGVGSFHYTEFAGNCGMGLAYEVKSFIPIIKGTLVDGGYELMIKIMTLFMVEYTSLSLYSVSSTQSRVIRYLKSEGWELNENSWTKNRNTGNRITTLFLKGK